MRFVRPQRSHLDDVIAPERVNSTREQAVLEFQQRCDGAAA